MKFEKEIIANIRKRSPSVCNKGYGVVPDCDVRGATGQTVYIETVYDDYL